MAPANKKKDEKDAKREDLAKEVKMTVHIKEPLEGIFEIADQFGFPRPRDLQSYLENGLTTEQADVSFTRAIAAPSCSAMPPRRPWPSRSMPRARIRIPFTTSHHNYYPPAPRPCANATTSTC